MCVDCIIDEFVYDSFSMVVVEDDLVACLEKQLKVLIGGGKLSDASQCLPGGAHVYAHLLAIGLSKKISSYLMRLSSLEFPIVMRAKSMIMP